MTSSFEDQLRSWLFAPLDANPIAIMCMNVCCKRVFDSVELFDQLAWMALCSCLKENSNGFL